MQRAMRITSVLMLLFAGDLLAQTPEAAKTAQPSLSSVPSSRLAHLRHGINASQWFAQIYDGKGYSKDHFESWVTNDDIARMQAMGFDHVRVSVNPEPPKPQILFDFSQPDVIAGDVIGYLDDAVKRITDRGLAVIIDIHPEEEFKAKLASDDFVERFVDFWRSLARHYAESKNPKFDPELIFFEILNEPKVQDRYRWSGIQAKIAAAIREGAPQYTIVATGAQGSMIDDLIFLDPLRDPNVIYSFHYYEPYEFTHQGATWSTNYFHFLKGVSYPSTPESALRLAALVPDALSRFYVVRYGMEHWDEKRIDSEVNQVHEWATRRKVFVLCDEFGVNKDPSTPPGDRARWIEDVRTALESKKIGWTFWDYNSVTFGVVGKTNEGVRFDDVALPALGRTVPKTH